MTHIFLDKALFFADENGFCVSDSSGNPFFCAGIFAGRKKIGTDSATLVCWLVGGKRDTPKIKK
jgi:hypothetical protein